MASVFISHSSADGTVVEEIAGVLRADGHEVFLDRHPDDGIQVGDHWEEVLYGRLHAADALVAVLTASYVDSRWCFAELALARSLGRLVLPLRVDAGVHHPLVADTQVLDHRADPAQAMAAVRDRLRALEARGGAAWDPKRPLFPGLAAFDTDDAAVFFGREAETRELVALVRSLTVQRLPRAALVMGASGSGKSSLVRAGLVPALIDDGWWAVPPILPGARPVRALTFAFAQVLKRLPGVDPVDLAALQVQIETDLDAVVDTVLLAAPGERQDLLLVIDQYEELFTRSASPEADAFHQILTRAAEPGRRTAVVATMRSEFQGDLLRCAAAGPLRLRPFPLTPLTPDRFRAVITGPAQDKNPREKP